jgi:glycosyltransferase involved in cell wall biosynthesis
VSVPRFSVLLPTHDRADVVGLAIRSMLDQTSADFELLVVGDGCTDRTADVVLDFGDPRIHWFDLPKAPFFGYANRNVALREARGDLVAFMAHDDLVLPDHLERLGALFDDPAVDLAYSRPVWVADDGLVVPFAVDLRDPVERHHFLEVGNSIPASCVMHRRACLERAGYWPEDVPGAADWELWKAIIRPADGANLAYLPVATALHFRASWRDPAVWGPAPLHGWLTLAADERRWPRALRVEVREGELPQAAVISLMERDGDAWATALRDGIDRALDLLAWTQAGELAESRGLADLARAEAVQARAEADLARAENAQARVEADLARAEADRSRQEAADAVERAEAAARAAAVALAEARAARAQTDELLGSRSWRLTAPLRQAKAMLRR